MDAEEHATPEAAAAEAFSAELAHWREVRGLSKKRLAVHMGFDPSYISHVESGRHRPTEDFARRADAVLSSGQAIWRRWRAYDAARHPIMPVEHALADPPPSDARVVCELVVLNEDARLTYVDGVYQVEIRRELRNVGTEPITRYPVRIAVDRYPDDPDRSNRLYRCSPLTWEELRLQAECGDEIMTWRTKHDRDAFKEVWLLFQNDAGRFPLYPGETTRIAYRYRVGEDKWGAWFQRAIRLPTGRLSIRLTFPASLDPAVWGTETSLTAAATPLRTAIVRRVASGPGGDTHVFSWASDRPTLHARYRLEWRFRAARTLGLAANGDWIGGASHREGGHGV